MKTGSKITIHLKELLHPSDSFFLLTACDVLAAFNSFSQIIITTTTSGYVLLLFSSEVRLRNLPKVTLLTMNNVEISA